MVPGRDGQNLAGGLILQGVELPLLHLHQHGAVLIHGLLRAVEIVVQIENVEGAGRRFRLCVRRQNLLDGIFALGQGDLALPEGLQVLEQHGRAEYQGAAGHHGQRPEPPGPGEAQVHGFFNQIVAHIAQGEEQLFFRLHTKIPSS